MATLLLAAVSWVVAVRRMDGMTMMGMAGLGSFVGFLGLWVWMMNAMMLPGATPAVVRLARDRGRILPVASFVVSYIVVWTAAGVAVYALYPLYRPHGYVDVGMFAIAAGVYELTPLKRHFRCQCSKAVQSGIQYGVSCVGSTILLMVLLVALGFMSVGWMLVVAVVVTIQKLLSPKAANHVPLALGLVALGVLLMAAPSWVPAVTLPM